MPLTVKRTGAEEYGRTMKVLLAGAAGAGKTRMSSTFPNPFYANVEGGLMSVADRAVPFIDVNSTDDLNSLLMALRQPPRARENMLGAPVQTVIIDTLDALQKLLIEERKRAEHKETMAIADWGWLGDQLRLIVRNYRNLDLNVIFCCHVKTQEDGETGQTFVAPALQGAMGDEIAAYVDIAGLLRAAPVNKVKDGKQVRVLQRLFQTSPDARHPWLKDRSGTLPMDLEVNLVNDGKNLMKMIFGATTLLPSEAVAEVAAPSPVATAVVPPPAAVAAPAVAPPPRRGRPPGSTNKPKGDPELIVPKSAPISAPVEEVSSREPEQEVAEVAEVAAELEQETPELESPQHALTDPEVPAGELEDLPPEPEPEPEAEVEPPALSSVPDLPPEDPDNMICSVCGKQIESVDYRDLSLIRFRQPLCKDDFVAKKAVKR